jgi:peptidoglycan biosynthesis protein MviN/MurJ (putative lipid II flippase)
MPEAPARSVARNSATVAAWTLVSRVTGLLRVVVIGAVLGPTWLANSFLATNTVPNLTYSVVAGPVLALVVVPALVNSLVHRGPGASVLYLRRLSGLLIAWSSVAALLLVLVSPALAWVLTLGVPEPQRGRAQLLTVGLLLLVAAQVVLYTVAALGAAAQQARERYALASAAPALENLGLMLTMAAVAVLHGPRPSVSDASFSVVVLLGAGATLSVALHAGVQVFGARRVGLSIRPATGWRHDEEVRAVADRLRRSIAVAALPAAGFFVLLALAATEPGGVLVFQIAYTIYVVPTALGARAVTTAVMPGMAAAVSLRDTARYAASWRQALSYTSMTGLPALCVLVVFSGAIAATLAAGELRSDDLIESLAVCTAILGVAQVAGGVHEVGRQALFADLDVRGPRLAGAVAFVVTVAGGTAALLLPDTIPLVTGLCLTVLLADMAAAATVVRRVQRKIRPEPAVDGRSLCATVVATLSMLPVLSLGWLLAGENREPVRDLFIMLPTAAVATAVFAAALAALTTRLGAPA